MLDTNEAVDRVADLVKRALAAGADAADAIYAGGASTSVDMRLGALENVERSEGEEIGLRVFVGKRSATTSSSAFTPEALNELAERGIAMARQAPEDEFAGLAPKDRLFTGSLPDLGIDDGGDPEPATLRQGALAVEEAARAVIGITNSEGGSMSATRNRVAVATSDGFANGYSGSSYSVGVSVLAGEGTGMQRDAAYHTTRHLSDLEASEEVGGRAGERAVARLNPRKIKSGTLPIVFDPRVSASMISHFVGAINGNSIARKTSFLLDKMGSQIFDSAITILDDPHRARGLRSKPFDGEGLPTAPTKLIDAGVLTTWLIDSASGRQLGLAPTGHATRGTSGAPGSGTTNTTLLPGSLSPADLMADIQEGLYVTEMIGTGVNPVTGDYSRGASGFLISKGELGQAIDEVTIAGNLIDMFAALTAANDLEYRYAVNAPTIRIDGMTLAGE